MVAIYLKNYVENHEYVPELWLEHILEYPHLDYARIQLALDYAKNHLKGMTTFYGRKTFLQGIEIADILLHLQLDQPTIIASLLINCIQHSPNSHDQIAEIFGTEVSDLL